MATLKSAKRPRSEDRGHLDWEWAEHAAKVAVSLQTAITTKQRMQVLETIHESCNSADYWMCSTIVRYYNDKHVFDLLLLQLGYVLNRTGSSNQEIERLLDCIALFFTYWPELSTESYISKLPCQFFTNVEDSLKRGIARPTLAIQHSCSSTSAGTTALLKSVGFLEHISHALSHFIQDNEVVLEILGLLKNMTFFADDTRAKIVGHRQLLKDLCKTAFDHTGFQCLERLSAVLRNLTISPGIRMDIARQSDVLAVFAKMLSVDERKILRNALSATTNLCINADSCMLVLTHCDGVIIDSVKRVAISDIDESTRKRAARILRLMARESAAPLIMSDDNLLQVLTHLALQDPSIDVRTEAAEAFGKCATFVRSPMVQFESILNALSMMAGSGAVPSETLARCFWEQTVHSANRRMILRKTTLMEALSSMVVDPDATTNTRQYICDGLCLLSEEADQAEVFPCSSILSVLIAIMKRKAEEESKLRDSALRTVLNLSRYTKFDDELSGKSELLPVLLRQITSNPSSEMKEETKKLIVRLAAAL